MSAVTDQEYMLTTVDNPWNPWTNWEEWFAFDRAKGYHTPGYLARIANISTELSEEDEDIETKQAIDEIVRLNVLGLYRKISADGTFLV